MNHDNLFELCTESLEAAKAAQAGGADRLELCADLAIGGVTAPKSLLKATLAAVSIPVHALIRPRGGDFVYSDAEFELMRAQIQYAKAAGAAAVVLGVLLPDGQVDVERTRQLVELARPMNVTFHRAFDESANLEQALEDVILTGADCLLTSGGAPGVLQGAAKIGSLQEQAGERIRIMAGGGLRLANLIEVVQRSGVTWLHGSLAQAPGAGTPPGTPRIVRVEDIQEAILLLQQASMQLQS